EQDERRWVGEGKDPEAEFARLYAEEPEVNSPDNTPTPLPWWRDARVLVGLVSVCAGPLLLLALVLLGVVLFLRRMRPRPARAGGSRQSRGLTRVRPRAASRPPAGPPSGPRRRRRAPGSRRARRRARPAPARAAVPSAPRTARGR